MKENPEELQRRFDALQQRVSRLSAAVLRVSSSLDLDTVLHEVVDSARALTGARYGVIATLDDGDGIQEFVATGFTPEERDQMVAWPDGPRLFEHFRGLGGPVRMADLPAYVRALGYSSDLMLAKTFQGAPMRYRDELVGIFFLAEKEGGQEFTAADEEIMTLFASQAATAIANARTHREERRARTGLEALIETTPVGVAVFDGRTGNAVSVNRELRRLVEPLRAPDQRMEELLELVTCRRGDGREIALAEFPIAQQFITPETVRGEEMTLSVPGGRSVTTLVNVTPIQTADGAVDLAVVTLQDLAPLEELERQRTEFLGLVAHELRTPLVSIKGSTATALAASPAPDPTEMLQFFRLIDEQADQMRRLIGDLLDQGRIETGTLSVSPEPAGVTGLLEQARKTFASSGRRHTVNIDAPEDLPRVMVDRARIVQVLNNLLANAAGHSHESSRIRIAAVRDGAHVAISVEDQGSGVSPDRLPHLFRKHAPAVGAESRRGLARVGLGLTICRGLVEAHGGRIRAESGGLGRGTRITFTLPVAGDAAAADAPGATPPPGRRAAKEAAGTAPILVVDDDPRTLRYVRNTLAEAGYAAVVTGDPQKVPELISTRRPRLVLLDLLLPGTDGIALMERVPELADVPVIFISAYGRDETICTALDAGAADYIVKPFSPTELTARVRAALRRGAESEPFLLGELAIDYEQRRVTVAGRPVELTATEYELLRVLSMNVGRVMTYDTLLRQAWSGRSRGARDPKLVRALVKRLRGKLGDDAADPAYIRNERAVGYQMPAPAGGTGTE